jgi:prepilin-type N-terminal cleavage/methylation domain-containing protein
MKNKQAGFTLAELLVVATLIGLLASLAVPSLLRASAQRRVTLAAGELAGALRQARSLAVTRGVNVALKLRTAADGTVSYTLYQDGDGDGVQNRDIDRGIDPAQSQPRRLQGLGGTVRFGLPTSYIPRAPGSRRRLTRLEDPVRFNRSDLASFSPLGESTPGSLYFTDGNALAVVRLYGRTGKVKLLRYNQRRELWY